MDNRRIFTNDNCTGCNRCISACTVPEANIAHMEGGRNKIVIDSDKCINCAKCIEVCPHDARDYVDDTEAFLRNLAAGEQISVLIAPAVRSNFRDHEKLLGLFRKMGVHAIYDTSFGADICTWGYIRHMQKNHAEGLISQPCPAVVSYIEKHQPDLIRTLAPVHSPAMCAAVYMRKYKGITGSIAFISPCIAKKDEFDDPNTGAMINYNVTFRKLDAALRARGLDWRTAQPDRFDNEQHGFGAIYPMPGGLKKNVHNVIPNAWVHQVEGQPLVRNFLSEYDSAAHSDDGHPFLVDILNCAHGCNQGTGALCGGGDGLQVDRAMHDAQQQAAGGKRRLKAVRAKAGQPKSLEEFDKSLTLEDFIRHYTAKQVQPIRVTQNQVETAYLSLNKMDRASRIVNCCSCGFETCEEMAKAIAKGINHVGNCVEYHKSVLSQHQAEIEEMLQRQEQSGQELRANVEKIFDALSENSQKSDATTEQVRRINEEVGAMRDIALRLNGMVDDLNNRLQQYVTLGTQIVSISTMTRLLSMNASVEAARAKEYGKGFAVVADEMKSLSDESAQSAREIISSNELVFPILDEVRSFSEVLNTRAGNISDSTTDILQAMYAISETEQEITEAASGILRENVTQDAVSGNQSYMQL